jgi:formate hydrogenlyase subunit 3/multisubunit Na+/H+ antiporter MnhD subunit
MFFSELGILFTAAQRSQWWVVAIFSITLCVVFVGVMTAMLPMVFGPPPENLKAHRPDEERWRNRTMLAAASVLLGLGFTLGSYQPEFVRNALQQAAATLTIPVSPPETALAQATGALP